MISRKTGLALSLPILAAGIAIAPAAHAADDPCFGPDSPHGAWPKIVAYTVSRVGEPIERTGAHDASLIGGLGDNNRLRIQLVLDRAVPVGCKVVLHFANVPGAPRLPDGRNGTPATMVLLGSKETSMSAGDGTAFATAEYPIIFDTEAPIRLSLTMSLGDGTEHFPFSFTLQPPIAWTPLVPSAAVRGAVPITVEHPVGWTVGAEPLVFALDTPAPGALYASNPGPNPSWPGVPAIARPFETINGPTRATVWFLPVGISGGSATISTTRHPGAPYAYRTTKRTFTVAPSGCKPVPSFVARPGGVELTLVNIGPGTCPALEIGVAAGTAVDGKRVTQWVSSKSLRANDKARVEFDTKGSPLPLALPASETGFTVVIRPGAADKDIAVPFTLTSRDQAIIRSK